MFNFSHILTELQAAIAVVSARHRALTPLLVAVWGRIGRMGTRLERLIALWRAGMLPKPRASRAGVTSKPSGERRRFPASAGWLAASVREAAVAGAKLQQLLTHEECVAFLAEVPQARRILRPLLHMLTARPQSAKVRTVVPAWARPTVAPLPPPTPAGLVLGPGGRLIWM